MKNGVEYGVGLFWWRRIGIGLVRVREKQDERTLYGI